MEGNAFCRIFAASSARHLYLNAVPPPSFPCQSKGKISKNLHFHEICYKFSNWPWWKATSSEFKILSPRVYNPTTTSLSPSRRMSRFTSAEFAKITWQHLRKLWSFKPPAAGVNWKTYKKKSPNSKYLRIAFRSFGGFPEIPLKPTKKSCNMLLIMACLARTCQAMEKSFPFPWPHVLLFHP